MTSERDEAARATWRALIQPQDARAFICVDETGAHFALSPRYAWARRGERAPGHVPRNWGKNTTLVAGLTVRGLQAPWTIEGAVDTDAFLVYVEEVLGPTLHPGQTVFIDNLSVHKAARIRAAIEARGCARVRVGVLAGLLARSHADRGSVLQNQGDPAPRSRAHAGGIAGWH